MYRRSPWQLYMLVSSALSGYVSRKWTQREERAGGSGGLGGGGIQCSQYTHLALGDTLAPTAASTKQIPLEIGTCYLATTHKATALSTMASVRPYSRRACVESLSNVYRQINERKKWRNKRKTGISGKNEADNEKKEGRVTLDYGVTCLEQWWTYNCEVMSGTRPGIRFWQSLTIKIVESWDLRFSRRWL